MDNHQILLTAINALNRIFPDFEIARCENFTEPTIYIMGEKFQCVVTPTLTIGEVTTLGTKETNGHKIFVIGKIAPLAQECLRKKGVNFMDCAGNCNLRHTKGDRVVFALANKGEKPVKLTSPTKYPLFQEAGLKVIYFFLQATDNVNLPFREIKDQTGVALGTIKNIVDGLAQAGFLQIVDGKRTLMKRQQLVEAWAMNYAQTLKPRILLTRMAFRDKEARNDWKQLQLPQGMAWGGEPAVAITDGYLEPGEFTIYTEIPAAHLMRTGVVTPDENGEIRIYQKFWPQPLTNNTVPPVLTYADLIGTHNDRLIEAAKRLEV